MSTAETFPVFSDFSAVLDPTQLRPLPSDWYVVVCDIQNSTQAIQEGRYREVNFISAASIIAVQNALTPVSIQSIFGGDGATFLCPPDLLTGMKEALLATQKMANQAFQLNLRVGAVQAEDLSKTGNPVLVGKFQSSPDFQQLVLSGRGVSLAEKWIKGGESHALAFGTATGERDADLSGLECRWKPVESQRGYVTSVVIQSLSDNPKECETDYRQILQELEAIAGWNDIHPIQPDALKLSGMLRPYLREMKAKRGNRSITDRAAYLAKSFLLTQTFRVLWRTIARHHGERYKRTLSQNTDFRKFDGMLKMVLDLSGHEQKRLVEYLDEMCACGRIAYGTHSAKEALLTCLIFDRALGKHFHFVDGNDGGYALAAKEFKARLARSRPDLKKAG